MSQEHPRVRDFNVAVKDIILEEARKLMDSRTGIDLSLIQI